MIRFVTGIDTAVGKSIATGLIAKSLTDQGKSVITQKIVQTGSSQPAEDIIEHRRIMGIPLTKDDTSGLTCSYVFTHASSPDLAAKKEGVTIDTQRITAATKELAKKYDHIIIEGAGGLMVPLNDSCSILDYLEDHRYPTILVSSSRLGSINHTLMSLELLRARSIPLVGLVYNRFNEKDSEIGNDSRDVFKEHMNNIGYDSPIIDMIELDNKSNPAACFTALL